MHRDTARWAVAVALAALAGGGCGGRSCDVTGRVTYNGSPLDRPDGQIVFVGPDGTQVEARIGPDGSYRAAGVPAGPNRVAVYYPNPKAGKGKVGKLRPGEPPPPAVSPFLTPDPYAAADTSGLSVDVGRGTVFDANLVGPAVP